MRNQIAQQVYETGFALYEAILFLDTHPCDEQALRFYEFMKEVNEQARQAYIENIGPLTAADVSVSDGWTWVQTPWPWEGGDC